MTITSISVERPSLRPVALDLYRDVHKGIRAELFAVTAAAGSIDPSDGDGLCALAQRIDVDIDMLVSHADHEDTHAQPAIEVHLPELARRIANEHEVLEAKMADLRTLAATTANAGSADRRFAAQTLYVELASFTSAYLDHQDVEERLVMPALEAAIGFDAVLVIHEAIVSNIPPDEFAQAMAIMLPAMNIDDRAEMLGGMRESAPSEVFAGVWALAGTVLDPSDYAALGTRLGMS